MSSESELLAHVTIRIKLSSSFNDRWTKNISKFQRKHWVMGIGLISSKAQLFMQRRSFTAGSVSDDELFVEVKQVFHSWNYLLACTNPLKHSIAITNWMHYSCWTNGELDHEFTIYRPNKYSEGVYQRINIGVERKSITSLKSVKVPRGHRLRTVMKRRRPARKPGWSMHFARVHCKHRLTWSTTTRTKVSC